MMIKNFVFYAFSTFINDFAAEKGPGHMCRVFGIVTLCGFTTCVPMCKYSLRNKEQRRQDSVANVKQMCLGRRTECGCTGIGRGIRGRTVDRLDEEWAYCCKMCILWKKPS